jgi:hypothetical protein
MPQALPRPLFAEPVFNEAGGLLPDPQGFLELHPSDKATYDLLDQEHLLEKNVVSFASSRVPDGGLYTLAEALGEGGAAVAAKIKEAGRIVFHSAGDTGASNDGKRGTFRDEIAVADALTNDLRNTASETDRPAFLYHLGDVVYNFGEAQYYYDQFYEPFRNYPRPIFAIPGNHDSFIVEGADEEPLTVFQRNFCATALGISKDARSLHRTAMTQPGIYFTLDAPFIRIIGLFSNSLEDPGLISSQAGLVKVWNSVPNIQLGYLRAQLQKISDEKYSGAVILAMHHPPFAYAPNDRTGRGGTHGSSPLMLRQIDTICKDIGVYPHLVLSGHAHNYQRFTRTIKFGNNQKTYEVPFIIVGNGGHNASPLVYQDYKHLQDPDQDIDVTYLESEPVFTGAKLRMATYDDYNYSYLRVTVDDTTLTMEYVPVTDNGGFGPDTITVDLANHRLTR